MNHPRQQAKTKVMEEASKSLYKYKPVLLGMALSSMLKEVSDDQIAEYETILKEPGDEREAQLIHNYDAVHGFIKEQIVEHGIEAPLLWQKGHIDRFSLLFYNQRQVCKYLLYYYYVRIKKNIFCLLHKVWDKNINIMQ